MHTFLKGICLKGNVIARLGFELAYYDSVVYRYNHYTTRTTPIYRCVYVCVHVGVVYTHTHTHIFIYMCVDEYRDIYFPIHVGLSSPAKEVIVLPLPFIASLFIYELRSR